MAKSPGLSRWLSEDKKLSSDWDDWVTNTYASNPIYSPEFSVIREVDISLKKNWSNPIFPNNGKSKNIFNVTGGWYIQKKLE
jgi:hypothetical protein